jgi:hypothetical protein
MRSPRKERALFGGKENRDKYFCKIINHNFTAIKMEKLHTKKGITGNILKDFLLLFSFAFYCINRKVYTL